MPQEVHPRIHTPLYGDHSHQAFMQQDQTLYNLTGSFQPAISDHYQHHPNGSGQGELLHQHYETQRLQAYYQTQPHDQFQQHLYSHQDIPYDAQQHTYQNVSYLPQPHSVESRSDSYLERIGYSEQNIRHALSYAGWNDDIRRTIYQKGGLPSTLITELSTQLKTDYERAIGHAVSTSVGRPNYHSMYAEQSRNLQTLKDTNIRSARIKRK